MHLRKLSPASIFLTGLGLGLSFPPFPFPFLAWVALVPLLNRWVRCADPGAILVEAYLSFLVMFAVAFSWPLAHVISGAAMASIGGLLATPLVMALPFAFSVSVRRKWGAEAGFVALVCFFLVMEGGLSRGPFAFPWTLLAHTQAEAVRFNQFVSLTGVAGLTAWVWMLNGAAFFLIRSRTKVSRARAIGSLVCLLALPFGFSQWSRTRIPPPEKWLSVGLVQPALTPETWSDVGDVSRVDTLMRLSEPLFADAATPSLVIWPETALPVAKDEVPQRAIYNRISDWTHERGTNLLTGAVTRASTRSASRLYYANSALVFREGSSIERYDKIHLVPFGERVPLLGYLPWLEALTVPAGGVSGYEPGSDFRLFRIDDVAFGVLICFESAFAGHARRYVEDGAGFLVTITQDGWWGRTPGYRQHLAISRLRAIENRRALIQVSVTGVSALILPDGSTTFETGWMERSTRTVRLPVYIGSTFYSRHGDWVTAMALVFSILFAASTYFGRPRR